MISTEAYGLLNVLAIFPMERLLRIGASNTQIATMKADWYSRTLDWQAQEASWLATQPDPVWVSYLGNWPPLVPIQNILFWNLLDSRWSYVAGMTDAYMDAYLDSYGVYGAVLTQIG